jgi:acyl carrier protein
MQAELEQYIARRQGILDRVRRMLVVSLNLRRAPDEIDPDTALFGTGLGMDSLDAVEIVVALEIEFKVKLVDPLERKRSLRSVNALVDLVLDAEASHVAV